MAKGLAALAVVLVALLLVTFAGSRLTAGAPETAVTPAAEDRARFEDIREALERGDLGANQFGSITGDISQYVFVTYSVPVSSHSVFGAEWALLLIEPAPADVALVEGDPVDIGAFSSGTVSATVLTTADRVQDARRMHLRYYVFGNALETWVVR
ncbi:MAG: hypothetical protein IKE30_07365 [Clostridia bacterium]|nr:hypothetical protein [Clostridia bacterium]